MTLALGWIIQASCAQDAETLRLREAELRSKAVTGLHAAADALQAEKQHGRALLLRREIWMEYAEDDKKARTGTGFVAVGRAWRLDPNALILDRDLKAKASRLRRIERKLDKLHDELREEHLALAKAWTTLGKTELAVPHWQRVLRFQPGDEAASQALAIREFEGFVGSELELRMLRRGRRIKQACDWLNETEFPTKELTGTLPLLEGAGLEHRGFETEFFQVWGTRSADELKRLAQDCERALLLCHTLFSVSDGELFVPVRRRNLVFLRGAGEYSTVLDACSSQFSADRLQFLRDVVDQCYLQSGGESLRVHKGENGLPVCQDQAVRGIVQDALGVDTEGLWEGAGHMACGFLLGRTLTFLQEQLKERTAASHVTRRLSPDLDVWQQIAQESAWSKSDTRSSELVLIRAARFTNEQRVKAWAICHYLAHWRPELLMELDRSRGKGPRTPPDIEAEFLRKTGVSLPKIDSDWRTFWARGDELRKAMVRDPLAALPKRAKKTGERARQLLSAVNAARAAARVGPLGCFLDSTPEFVAVRRYEKDLIKAERELKKQEARRKKGKKAKPVEMPVRPEAIGRSVLWSRTKKPLDAVAEWMAQPRLRDMLLAPGRELFSVASDPGVGYVLGAGLARSMRRGAPLAWPRHRQREIPPSASIAGLDFVVRKKLQELGLAADAVIGMPLTLHFARKVQPAPLMQQVRCRVFANNLPVKGLVVHYVGTDAERTAAESCNGPAADGLVAFVPLQPFAAGAQVDVQWDVPQVLLVEARDRAKVFPPVVFTVQK
ncbi:MAG: hypothetical protein AB8H80_06980 [Planctomycetota bacterium]